MELVESVDRSQVDYEVERYGRLVVLGVPYIARLGEVEESVHARAALVGTIRFAAQIVQSELQRVGLGAHGGLGPRRYTVGVDGAQAEFVVGLGCEVDELQLGAADGRIEHVAELDLVIVGVLHLVPCGSYGICLYPLVVDGELRRIKLAVRRAKTVFGIEYESVDDHCLLAGRDVGFGEFYVYNGVFCDYLLREIAVGGGEAVHVGRGVVEPYVAALLELLARCGSRELHAAAVHRRGYALGLGGGVYAELGGLVGHESVETALCGVYGDNRAASPVVGLFTDGCRLDERRGELAAAVCLGFAVVVVFDERRISRGIKFVYASCFVDLRHVVVGIGHRDDRAVTHEQRQFPQRCVERVDYAVARVFVAREVVDPFAVGEIYAVAYVVALLVGRRIAIYGSREEPRAVHVLIARGRPQRVGIGRDEHHGADHRHAVHRFASYGVCVGHELRFEFQIPAVDRGRRLAQRVGIFLVRTPAVHVELHRREGFPLEIARVDYGLLAAEDAVHVGRYVGLARESRTDVGRDVETDVFPLATRLVARPDACVTLCARPAVERYDERTRVVAVIRHDLRHVGYAVQAERVTRADPRHVGLQDAHARVADLFYDIALQQCAHLGFGVQVRLRPQAYLHALLAGVIAQLLQVADVAVERLGLSVSRTVSVVGQKPAQRHVVGGVTVDDRARRELVVILLAVERLFHAAVIALALLVTLAVLERYAVFRLDPIVAVVGVEVTLVKAEFREKNGVARQLVVVV